MSSDPDLLREALALHQHGQLEEAARLYDELVRVNPLTADAWHLLGVVRQQQGRRAEAVEHIRRAIALRDDVWSYYSNQAVALQELGRFDEAIAACQAALTLAPREVQLYNNLGTALADAGRIDEAAQAFHQALSIVPDHAEAYYNLGNLYHGAGRAREAQRCYERCLTAEPGHAKARANLGLLLLDTGRTTDAIEALRQAVAAEPNRPETLYQLAKAHQSLGQSAAALRAATQAIRLRPAFADAHVLRGTLWLQGGNLAEGWPEFEWRWRREGGSRRMAFPQPLWDGSRLNGKKILLYGEQEPKDEILFASCLPELCREADECVIECDPRLVTLFRRSFDNAIVNARAKSARLYRPRGDRPIDVQSALGDAPRYRRPTLDAFPAARAFLQAEPEQCRRHAERLAALPSGLRVGVAWRDVYSAGGTRVEELSNWQEIVRTAGAQFICLQGGDTNREWDTARRACNPSMWQWYDQDFVYDFDALAALLVNCDLVITGPSLVAHLAAALGVETWIVLPRKADWYWFTGRNESPWYPRVRLFRESSEPGAPTAVARVAEALGERIASECAVEVPESEPMQLPRESQPYPVVVTSQVAAQFREASRLAEEGKFSEAERIYRAMLERMPDSAEVMHLLGAIAQRDKRRDEAIGLLQKSVERCWLNPFAFFHLALAYSEAGRTAEAAEALVRAIALRPKFPEAHMNLGAYLERIQRFDTALPYALSAAELHSQSATTFYNLGNLRLLLGHIDESLEAYGETLKRNPELVKAHWNRAMTMLLARRFREGWNEWDFREEAGEVLIDKFAIPVWDGSSLAGKTLLVHAEQGVGDEVMFASCLPELIEQAGHVVVACEPRLERLFARSFPKVSVHGVKRPRSTPWTPPEGIDLAISAGGVPRFLRPTIESFPRHERFLYADPEEVLRWRGRYEALGEGLKVGISWRAGGKPGEQRRRTATIDDWRPLLSTPGVVWINLQYGDCTSDLALVRNRFGVEVHDFDEGDPLFDLDGFAARTRAVDLVLSIGNTTIHMAGALGVPTWTLLPQVPGWRYMIEGDELLWYHSVRLFRQHRPDDWPTLFDRIAKLLRARVAAGSSWQPAAQPPRGDVRRLPPTATSTVKSILAKGMKLHREGQLNAALVCYDDVLRQVPEQPDALQLVGLIASQQGRQDDAIAMMRRSLAIADGQPCVHFNLGASLDALGRGDEALAAYRRAVELDPNMADAHLNLGVLLTKQGRWDEAMASYRRALNLRPKFAKAHNNLGVALLRQGHTAEAISRFERAMELEPGDIDAERNRARALAKLERWPESLAAYDRLLAAHPEETDTALERQVVASRFGIAKPIPAPHAPFDGAKTARSRAAAEERA